MRRMRVITWLRKDTNEQHATLIIELLQNDKVTWDNRFQMSREEFNQLKEAIIQADTTWE